MSVMDFELDLQVHFLDTGVTGRSVEAHSWDAHSVEAHSVEQHDDAEGHGMASVYP